MKVKLYGVRGSLPAPLRNAEYRVKLEEILKRSIASGLKSEEQIASFLDHLPGHLSHVVGGDTTCVRVDSDDGDVYILDAGTGLRPLGDELMAGPWGKGQGKIHIFFTHTHWDHIQGLPFFKPIYIPGNELHLYSPLPDLEDRMAYQTTDRFFPMPFHNSASTKFFHQLKQGESIHLDGGLQLDSHPLKHPGGSQAYRFKSEAGTFIFATDAEFTGEDLMSRPDDAAFFDQAELLVMDAQYTLDESFSKFDWGHTSYTMAVNCAVHWKVKNLVLTHHEPAYSDEKIFENFKNAIEHRMALQHSSPRIFLARESAEFDIKALKSGPAQGA
ncbi:MAG TPA: MBL fold metallo-hydrolase [Leptospiraceae bacterium]|nr:MBL fold metallo-hydrolase [Spirochaetaceae bacterium]HBS05425.1 MBL fold metallo-hydrolase [Leptospiraceae bacterium]|tara:strand:- start:23855 stop:24841 length:987 start_codon:yes stop_codon:yes gene_type:complete